MDTKGANGGKCTRCGLPLEIHDADNWRGCVVVVREEIRRANARIGSLEAFLVAAVTAAIGEEFEEFAEERGLEEGES